MVSSSNRPQRRNIPFKRLALSLAGDRTLGVKGKPQAPPILPLIPINLPRTLIVTPKRATDPRRDFHKLFGETNVPEEKVLTLDDVAPVKVRQCPHGVRLTRSEYEFEASYRGRPYCRKMNGRIIFMYPKSFECIQCHPVCIHGLELTEEEVKTGKRFSAACPGCTNTVTNPAAIAKFLTKNGAGQYDGMSLIEGRFVTSYGLVITKAGKNFAQGGGSKEMERTDAENVEIQDTIAEGVIAVRTPGGRDTSGYGPDTEIDDEVGHWGSDSTGDPISFVPSQTVHAFESVRQESVKELLDIVSYEIVRDENKGKVVDGELYPYGWIVTANDKEIGKFKTKREAEEHLAEVKETDLLDFKTERSKASKKVLEHKATDILSTVEEPYTPEKLTGLKDQKVNTGPFGWKESETRKLQDEIVEEVERYDTPVRTYREDSEKE
jgi:hypothetical protein